MIECETKIHKSISICQLFAFPRNQIPIDDFETSRQYLNNWHHYSIIDLSNNEKKIQIVPKKNYFFSFFFDKAQSTNNHYTAFIFPLHFYCFQFFFSALFLSFLSLTRVRVRLFISLSLCGIASASIKMSLCCVYISTICDLSFCDSQFLLLKKKRKTLRAFEILHT